MRADEFISEAQKLDEVLPLIVGAARAIGGAAAKGVGSAVAKGVSTATSKAANSVLSRSSAVAGGVASKVAPTVTATAQAAKRAVGQPMGQAIPKSPQMQNAIGNLAKAKMMQPGATIQLPTAGTGGPTDFTITKVTGDDVEIENPDGTTDPTQPEKLVYKKQDLMKSMTK